MVTVAVFVPTDFPSLVLLVLPVLAWGALRNGSYESLAQMAVAVGISMPSPRPATARSRARTSGFDLPVDLQGILLATFAIVCALVVLSLRLTVGEQLENARQVGAERDRLQNVVDGITGVAIIGADLEGRCTLFNPGAERLLGYDAAEVLGQSTRMLHSDRAVAAKGGRARRGRRLLGGRARPSSAAARPRWASSARTARSAATRCRSTGSSTTAARRSAT